MKRETRIIKEIIESFKTKNYNPGLILIHIHDGVLVPSEIIETVQLKPMN